MNQIMKIILMKKKILKSQKNIKKLSERKKIKYFILIVLKKSFIN